MLGPWVDRPWLNWVAGVIVGTLLVLSGILMATTLFHGLNVVAVAGYLAGALVVVVVAAIPVLRWMARRQPAPAGPRPAGPASTATPGACPRYPAGARRLVTGHPARHDRAARLPGRRRTAIGGQGDSAQPLTACRIRRATSPYRSKFSGSPAAL